MPKAQATTAQICRAVEAAKKMGETVYGYSVDGNVITVHITPMPSAGTATSAKPDFDKWFKDDD